MKKVYLQDHSDMTGAGNWIYEGYRRAWESLGFETQYILGDIHEFQEVFKNLENPNNDIRMMLTDGFYNLFVNMPEEDDRWECLVERITKNAKIYLYAQPTHFPMPWGSHVNFKSFCSPELIQETNLLDNVKLWSFVDINKDYYPLWKHIETVPLAFDNIGYEYLEDEKYKFDVCFVGGRANNGFDEKYKIMMSHFSAFKDSGLKCGIFVGKNLTHEQENKLLYNSKVAINVHDAYQRKLRLDTNERTFKALGLTGALVADDEGQLQRLFPDVKRTNDPKEMVKFVKEYVNMPEEKLSAIKETNRKMILDNHTYVHRVKQLMEL